MSGHATKLNVWAFAFALGITWAIGLLIMGWISAGSNWGAQLIQILASAYIGYAPTFAGAIIGAIWGFCDWFIGGLIIAWVYNLCSCKSCKQE